ncbi:MULTISPECIES: enoyl-CoA hydratase/isomerase family protein [unclassified Sphingobium]|uniref:enoyl-CoA hydratase/isomerase family protein n=1 Tax=unclassified Sphingobium TaxID=2611147 RepID=UPI000D17A042|nr:MULTISPECIES: enoyl-CoA hydratase-related protein [unclassified Sphingobium]MBG6120019.1 enoyl-CoA hydratase/carnithine racemase [Sphingobium sp. JAI105]PSO12924.1 enoyl-CoA hydratase [Sphingobium sp. AEW4]TWD05780.1 enoyl-CoA hydratase/carnithine racemase [Sphingobium sp. AEW010]TWD23333.1 enoyl-CoA hydratase/carnithine racemase [Sphingobium sp. AEW013]TWD25193.1 enoyl-CoA hydratase/carnithine racemase [Sphingobium sp. AEW001]
MNIENPILVERDGHIAIVTLNRPDRLNAVDHELHIKLADELLALSDDLSVRAIILTGAGKAFSAGGDIKAMAARAGTEQGIRHALGVPALGRRLIHAIFDVETPIIAAVNGDAMGLGATIAVCCDVSVIAEDAKFGDTHVRVGLVAGDGGAAIWPLLIGANKAKDFLMRGRVIDGTEAERQGIINYVAPRDGVMDKAMEIARDIAKLPPLAVRWSKASVNKSVRAQINQVFDLSIAYEALTMVSADHCEAANAFAEKRKPSFEGR